MKTFTAIAAIAFLWRPAPPPQPLIVTISGQHPYLLVQVRGWTDWRLAAQVCDQEAARRGLIVRGKEIFYPPKEALVNCYLRPNR